MTSFVLRVLVLISDISCLQLGSAELFVQESKFLIYGNGKEKPPTGFMFEKQQMHGLYFNQSPSKVFYLFNPINFANTGTKYYIRLNRFALG